MKSNKITWLGTLAALLFALIPQMKAQEVDDLQEYLDQLAVEQTESQAQRPRKGQSIEIPVGLTEVDLSKFTSYQNRTKTLTVKTSVKFTNGTINASPDYTGGTCLLKVYGGATVVLDATAGVNAGAASSQNCLAAVGIYEGSTFYECGDITAPNNGAGIAIYIDGANDTFVYVSGTLKGTISNKNNGTVIGIEKGGWYKLIGKKMMLNGSPQGEYMLLRSDGYLEWNNKGDGNLTIAVYIDSADDHVLRFYDNANNYQKITYMEGNTVRLLAEDGVQRTFTIVDITKEQLLAMLDAIGEKLAAIEPLKQQAEGYFSTLDINAIPDNLRTYVAGAIEALQPYITQYQTALEQYNLLRQQVNAMTDNDDGTLHDQIVALQTAVDNAYNTLNVNVALMVEQIKARAADDLAQRLAEMGARVQNQQAQNNAQYEFRRTLNNQIGESGWYFMRKGTDEFYVELYKIQADIEKNAGEISYFINDDNGYNDLINNHVIATIDDVVTFYTNYNSLLARLTGIESEAAMINAELEQLQSLFNTLEVNFPDEELAFTIRPTNLDKELQLGYKSNRGFVMTSAGMMWFEQKEGADFYLTDAEGNYIVASSGSTALRAGSKAEATVWTGQSIGNGNYTFYSKATNRYLGYSGINVNNAIIASTSAYSWTITESELDDLQAFLNLLAEEEETSGGGGSDLTEKDTLDYVLPFFDPDQPVTPTDPFIFPKVPYPVHIIVPDGGYWPIPRPVPGQPTPKDFHPIYIPKGSHAIIDASTFRDIIGGDHIIYVEGTLEININIYIYIMNWDWFIHVGPGGRVIWRPQPGTGDWPRIKNEGTMDIEEGGLDYVENTGTVNHKYGTINWIVNRYIYYFTGGLINTLHNYGQHYHQGGNVLTAENFSGGTYTMTGGSINNTVVNETDTVFINRGTFYFRGGIIGGYGGRLIYHGPGAVMRIDGGQFDFTYVKYYWIEAHADYYIRGDYDYKPTVPVLLAPSVTIRILYNWIYKFNIVFIGGRPTPRHPLFWADGFTFNFNFFKFIGWDLPNKRWRWYVNEEQNTIEPRDEEVEDEDDLQAYLDWLAENQDGESASTEEQPQELDLKGRDIVITKPVEWPAGCHVYIRDGRFIPRGNWTHSRMFHIPATTTVRYEYVIIDLSSTTHYYLNGMPVQRNIFEVYGIFHFGIGCYVKGYFNTSWQPTDSNIPGSVVYIDPEAKFYLDGGRFDNVIFRINTVINIFVTQSFEYNIYVYLPAASRYEGFSFMAPFGDYKFTLSDLRRIVFWNCGSWGVRVLPDYGYLTLFDKIAATPTANIPSHSKVEEGTEVELSCVTKEATIYYTLDGSDPRIDSDSRFIYDGTPIIVNKNTKVKAVGTLPEMGESDVVTFVYFVNYGDLNYDGKVDIADGVTVLNIMAINGYDDFADLNEDGKIDIADFVCILNIMAEQ